MHTEYATGAGPTGIVATDFTGLGNSDLAVTNQTDGNLDILVGNGNGTFNAPLPIGTGTGPVAVLAADLNGDNAQDAIVVDKTSKEVTVILNTVQSLTNSSSSQTAYPSAEYLDLGLKVKATPRLHSNNEVTLHLEFDIKSLTGTSVNGIPILSSRTVEQTVRLRENETSILSGILQSNEANVIRGLPYSATAPGVGDLTGQNSNNLDDTELLILVTPRALRLPPHDVPALYAGHGEPSSQTGALPQQPLLPITPGAPPSGTAPGTPGSQPGAPSFAPSGFGQQPGQPGQPSQPGLQPGPPSQQPVPPPPQPVPGEPIGPILPIR